MEPLLALIGWLWVVPVAAAGGAAAWIGLKVNRRRRPSRAMSRGTARRLELDAALHDLHEAQDSAIRSRAEVQAAQADVLRLQAGRPDLAHPSPPPSAALAGARRRLQIAQREVKASFADIRARRAAVKAARATMPAWNAGRDAEPLARLMAEHDAILVRWMAYETDPALAIAYPSMSDVRSPALASFLREQRLAQQLRPSSSSARTTPAAYAAYRDSVRRLRHALDAAELDARRQAGESVPTAGEAVADAWSGITQGLADGAQRAFWSSVDAIRERSRRPRP